MCLGIPGEITRITDHERQLGRVEIGGIGREVNLACIVEDGKAPENYLGAWVLVHVGFAMSVIDDDEARATLALLNALGDMQKSSNHEIS